MSPNRHSIAAVSTAKKLNTPLKASVVLLTSMILTACNTTDDPSYKLDDIFSPSQSVIDGQLKAEKEKAEKAKAEADAALAAKEKAEAALAAAEKAAIEAKKESDAAIAAAEKDKQEAEDALANAGGGNKEELQKIADEKAKLAKEAQSAADVAKTTAQAAAEAAEQAAASAKIKNTPESEKSGVQSLNVNVVPLGKVFKTTTRDFTAAENSIVARADLASKDPAKPDEPGALGKLTISTSGDGDKDVVGTNGFKAHADNTIVAALGQELPLAYTSTYKDFGDDMRIGHIDGKAVLSGIELPVNGAAVIGNATQAASMPIEGKVGYTGDATYRKLGIGNNIEFGTSVFTADFVAKNVKGDLTFSDKKIGIEANITGNELTGSKDGYKADGGFFGGDAQYLGGVYEGNGAQGTYGAKSDKQIQADKVANESADKAAAANDKAAAANKALADAQAAAEKAKKDAEKAQAAADNSGNSGNGQALQDALDKLEAAEKAAEQAKQEAQTAIQNAKDAAQKEVEAVKAKLATAQDEKIKAEKDAAVKIAAAEAAAADDIAEAERLADDARIKAEKARTAQEQAEAALAEAEKKAEELQAQLDALKTGVQHLSVDASALKQGVKTTTTRDFAIRSSSDVDARADFALDILPKPITIQVSGDNDAETKNGFKAYQGIGNVTGEGDLAYIATYKDFGNGIMRIAHIDGAAANGAVPVDGVAVVGNKTATLPTEGTFEYAGDATNRKVGVDKAIEYGSSKFTADFVASKVDGTLKFAQAGEIGLSADINGNEFSGAAANNTGYNTEGAFYGKDANFIGGIYEGNGSQGTFGAQKGGTLADLVVPVDPTPVEPSEGADINMTGFQSTALSSLERPLPFGQGQLDSAIGYSAIRGDKDTWSGNQADVADDGTLPDNKVLNTGDNFTAFDTLSLRADMVKPKSIQKPLEISLPEGESTSTGTIGVEAGKPGFNPDFKYNAVYKNFDTQMKTQMQTGHVYGFINSGVAGDVSRVANIYVQGNLTSQAYMDYLAEVNDGKAQYVGSATYIENIHLGDFNIAKSGGLIDKWTASPAAGAVTAPVNGTSNFDVDFAAKKVAGTLSFDPGNYKYMPDGNQISIDANITGNTFAVNDGVIDTAGGFYGDKAGFLGGIYQDAGDIAGGKGAGAGTGTKFQGTFGAEKQ